MYKKPEDNRAAQPMTKVMIKLKFSRVKAIRSKLKTKMCNMLVIIKEKEECATTKDQIIRECASKYYDNLRIR